jgi:putative phosphoesterase
VKIGVISDTHGYLDPKVESLFQGVDHILHAGDIGFASIILDLEFIAPVTAVLGNTDAELSFKETESLELGGRKIIVHHIVNPGELSDQLSRRIQRERPDLVVFGHTHKPYSETVNGIHFFNPGYAGKPRFGAERSVAILELAAGVFKPRFIRL